MFIRVLGSLIRSNPCRWLLGLILLFTVFPGIDLWVSGLFYRNEGGFFLRWFPPFEFIRKDLPTILMVGVLAVVVLWLAGRVRGRAWFGIDGRIAGYLVSSLVIGPGLIVNTLFKEHWGRARPGTIIEFGGQSHFTSPLTLAGQCDHNCSFMSGHAALGYWMVAVAFLAPPAWRDRAIAAALIFGSGVGFCRIAQGAHFFSDVIYAGVVTVSVAWVLHNVAVGRNQKDLSY